MRWKGMSSGWHNDLPWLILKRYQPQLSHPDDITWKSMSSWWHNEIAVTHPDDMPTPAMSSGWHNVSAMTLLFPVSHLDDLGVKLVISHGWHRTTSSGWLKDTVVCHPDDLRLNYCQYLNSWRYPIRMTSLLVVSHPDDLWTLQYVIRMTYHTTICHPDDLTKIGISSGWVKTMLSCHPDDIHFHS